MLIRITICYHLTSVKWAITKEIRNRINRIWEKMRSMHYGRCMFVIF